MSKKTSAPPVADPTTCIFIHFITFLFTVTFRVPFGTKEKLYSLDEKPQELYRRLINEFLEKYD